MSYRKKFDRTVKADYKGIIHVDYIPGNQNRDPIITVKFEGEHTSNTFHGIGRFNIHDYAEENVQVQVDVDTTPFDSSVDSCKKQVAGLTTSIGVMNTAQCHAISENANKVSKTIVDGFFHTVRTDLATQKAELEQTIETRLILLRQQATSLQEKQKAMSDDYARTTARYQKIFEDLNNELSGRIHQIDQPIFKIVKDIDEQSDRMLHTDLIQTAVTISKESSLLQAQINAATVKHHALEAMRQAQAFLTSKALSEKAMQNTCIEGNGDDGYLVPVCYMRTESEGKQVQQICEIPDYYSSKNPKLKDHLCEQLEKIELGNMNASDKDRLNSYILSEIDNNIVNDDEHSDRVRSLINKMLNQ